jgi:NTE family protein
VMYYNRVMALPDPLGSGAYLGASAEVGWIKDRVDGLLSPGTLFAGSLFVGADTFAGPAYLGIGYGTGNNFGVYLLLGAP